MSKRRFIVYQKNCPRSIVISDESEMTDQEVEIEIKKCFTQKDITQLKTAEDILFLRPSEISAIMIHKYSEKDEEQKPQDGNDLKITDEHVDKKKG